MKLMLRIAALVLATFSFSAFGQIGNYPALIGQKGATAPSTCAVGQLFFDTDAAAGSNILGCTATNVWTAQAGGGGSGTVTSVGWTGGIVSIATATTTPAFTIAGTSGGIPYFSSASTWATSAALTQYNVVLGGGAGAAPAALGSVGTSGQVLTSNGAGANPSWQNAVGGGAALSGITAATAGNTIASGNNHSQIWNWALTSNSVNAFTFGETTAATNGTSTSGVPNQSILRLTTLAASTASPLSVYSRAAHVFSVSPSAPQILGGDGSVGSPTYSFAARTGMGFYNQTGDSNTIGVAAGGVFQAQFNTQGLQLKAGTVLLPSLANNSDNATGLSWPSAFNLVSSINGIENVRLTAGDSLYSRALADAVGYSLSFRKARGTVASPTVITTGDDLAKFAAYGYVGATGTYVEAANIAFDSDGTIADTSTGVGGVMRFATRKVAGTVTERLTVDNNETAAETSVLISINGGAPVRVSKGANDSGGAGFAVLRIPN